MSECFAVLEQLTVTPAFQKLFCCSGLSRYSPMKKVAKIAPMASQTKNPAQPKLLTRGRIVPGAAPESCIQRHQPSSKKSSKLMLSILGELVFKGWLISLPVPSFKDFCRNPSQGWLQLNSLWGFEVAKLGVLKVNASELLIYVAWCFI